MTATRKTILTRPSDRELMFTRSFDAPRALVWQAWTDPAQLARWWGPDGFSVTTHEHKMQPNGVWRLTMHGPDGRDYHNRIVYLEVKPPERIVYKHAGEAGDEPVNFQTTVTFAEQDGVTTLAMRAEFQTAADLRYVIEHYGADKGGEQTIGRLADHVNMLTSDQPEFLITRIFDAPRNLVWQAWTDPAMLAQWFGPKGCTIRIHSFDVRPGGVWHSCMTMPGGEEMWAKFVYREVLAPHRLVWLHSFSDPEQNLTHHPMSPTWPLIMLTTVTFDEIGGKTKMTLSWVPYEASDIERQTFVEGMAGMNIGWSGSFELLDAFFAKTLGSPAA